VATKSRPAESAVKLPKSGTVPVAPDAVGVSDTERARRIVEEEQARLGMTEQA